MFRWNKMKEDTYQTNLSGREQVFFVPPPHNFFLLCKSVQVLDKHIRGGGGRTKNKFPKGNGIIQTGNVIISLSSWNLIKNLFCKMFLIWSEKCSLICQVDESVIYIEIYSKMAKSNTIRDVLLVAISNNFSCSISKVSTRGVQKSKKLEFEWADCFFPLHCVSGLTKNIFSFLAIIFHPPLATYIIQRKF